MLKCHYIWHCYNVTDLKNSTLNLQTLNNWSYLFIQWNVLHAYIQQGLQPGIDE